MIWNPSIAYMRIKTEISSSGLIIGEPPISVRDYLTGDEPKKFHQDSINPAYTVVHIPSLNGHNQNAYNIVFGIVYKTSKFSFMAPHIVVQYEKAIDGKNSEVQARVYIDLYADKVSEVTVSGDTGNDILKNIKSIEGMSLEDGVQALFDAIIRSRA